MGEIVNINNYQVKPQNNQGLIELTEDMLLEVQKNSVNANNSIKVPFTEIATLGAGVSSLLPAFRTVTQSTSFNVQGLYQLKNATAGQLKYSPKYDAFWGAMNKTGGGSTMGIFTETGPLSSTSTAVAAVNPATLLMCAALLSIEKELKNIATEVSQIISFLEREKEAEIEADLQTLLSISEKYKNNWDNEQFISSNHKMLSDIQRTARKNMISYKKKVAEVLAQKTLFSVNSKIKNTLESLLKDFQFYRLSLYSFAMASFMEIMLSGNFGENNISTIRQELEEFAYEYRKNFSDCSEKLEKLSHSSVEANLLQGVGIVSDKAGKLVGNIPVIKKAPVNGILQDGGAKLKNNANKMKFEAVESFSHISNPNIGMFINKMSDLEKIYNHTESICIDNSGFYLVAG